jgi:hypothetical protein
VPALSAATQPEPAALASAGLVTPAVATVARAVMLRRVSPGALVAVAVAVAMTVAVPVAVMAPRASRVQA